jgi:glutamate carboxypeptidase
MQCGRCATLEIPVRRGIIMQINSDEEVGSESSRALTEKNARRSAAVLLLEPATGSGRQAQNCAQRHRRLYGDGDRQGNAFRPRLSPAGASAVLELARQIERIAGFTDLKQRHHRQSRASSTGGTRVNVVAAEARAEVDMRVLRLKDAAAVDRKFRALRPVDTRCAIEISGGLNRPPMERIPGTVQLLHKAQALARELGIELDESTVGGGSDGNFTAALGVPTLDGLGAVGEGAHALNESILVDRIADRTALLAKLVAAL